MPKPDRIVDPAAIQLAAAIIIARGHHNLLEGNDAEAAEYAVRVHDRCQVALKQRKPYQPPPAP